MKLYLKHKKIQKLVKEIAGDISRVYYLHKMQTGYTKPIHLIGVMHGAMPFLVALSQAIPKDIPLVIDTINCTSYKGTIKGKFNITMMTSRGMKDAWVIIVDDIVDTGETMERIVLRLGRSQYGIKNIQTCTLLKRYTANFYPDYVGKFVDNLEWFVGYGMDDNGLSRNLKDIYIKT